MSRFLRPQRAKGVSAIRNSDAANKGMGLRRHVPFILHLVQERLALGEDESQTALVALQRCPGSIHRFGIDLEAALRSGSLLPHAVEHEPGHTLKTLPPYSNPITSPP